MRFISADIVYPVSTDPVRNGIIVLDDDKIVEVIDPSLTDSPPIEKIERMDGALCPGFVNAHCHLELSHLGGKLKMNTGLPGFIRQIVSLREADVSARQNAMLAADRKMFESGISVTGDISNDETSIEVKKRSGILYHTFVELYDLSHENTEKALQKGKMLYDLFCNSGLSVSITPHAPYSVTGSLLSRISEFCLNRSLPVTIHNQESESENEMFLKGTGALLELLKNSDPSYHSWKAPEMTSLAWMLSHFDRELMIQFVHNTFAGSNDVVSASGIRAYWCICAKANLFIESKLPDIHMFRKNDCRITIGTDSLASNDELSIVGEMKIIHEKFPEISLGEMIGWATHNGAEFLKVNDRFGSFTKNKRPGIVHISNVSQDALRLSDKSESRRVV